MAAFARRLTPPAFLLAAVLLAGCAPKGPPTCAVSGSVTVNGQPMEAGEITFADDDLKVASATLPVKQGEFRGEAKAGKKKVRVYMKKQVPGTDPPMYNEGLAGRYNADTELTAEVDPKSDNKFVFKLTAP